MTKYNKSNSQQFNFYAPYQTEFDKYLGSSVSAASYHFYCKFTEIICSQSQQWDRRFCASDNFLKGQ